MDRSAALALALALVLALCAGAPGAGAAPDTGAWREKSFNGHTRYQVTRQGDGEQIEAEAFGTASALYRQESIDLTRTPVLRWRWQVERIYQGDFDERATTGDDFPARLYVVVKTGLFPWQRRAINYVWSSRGRVGDSWDNPYTNKVRMVALEAGPEHLGRWREESRNLVEDFRRFFDLEATRLEGYAVMVDGDDTGRHGQARFADIRFEGE